MSPSPELAAARVAEFVRSVYGLDARQVALLDRLSDADLTAYRVETDDGPLFLKLRRDAPPPPLAGYLADSGMTRVLAPLPPLDRRRPGVLAGWTATLYPFVEGENAFQRPLTRRQWTALGAIVRAVHGAQPPPSVTAAMRHETYADTWRARVRACLAALPSQHLDDDVARDLVHVLAANTPRITSLVQHADSLAASLRDRALPLVPCHGDLHAGNVLVDSAGSLTIVDWDDPVLAPKERDLMFVGAGIGGVWNRPEEAAAFYRGYGPATVDAEALAYYRCERVVEDVAVFHDALLLGRGDTLAERQQSLRKFVAAFLPNDVVEIAERTFAAL
ncbi:MAG TPA: aminoglycoside phosphotransferase family protein [Dehalococcoidia bacterium]|nr:aminoglycoside phosphotransferase family protein [Dehalococcoidia bacterium]